jgi:hypothetical protein
VKATGLTVGNITGAQSGFITNNANGWGVGVGAASGIEFSVSGDISASVTVIGTQGVFAGAGRPLAFNSGTHLGCVFDGTLTLMTFAFGNTWSGAYNQTLQGIYTNWPTLTIVSPTNAPGLALNGSFTATNGVFGQYAYANAGTGAVTITSATLLFTNWNYSKQFGGVSALETNTTFTITKAGDYRIQFGGRFATTGNGDIMSLNIVTNDVVCSLISLGFTSSANVKDETGFKALVLALPASCRVGMNVTNNTPGSTFTVNQILLDIQGAN